MSSKVIFVPKNEFAEAYIPAPEPSIYSIPEWYRKNEKYVDSEKEHLKNGTVNLTVKKCMAVFDTMNAGYLLKFPVDIYIDATGKRIVYSQANPEEQGIVSMHDPKQVKDMPFDRDIYMDEIFKIHHQWLIKTESGTSCLFIHPFFHDDLPFKTIDGMVDTDRFMSDGTFPMLIKRGFKGTIKKGTPLAQAIPFQREEYKIEIGKFEEYKDDIVKQRYLLRSQFENGYKDNMWTRKHYE
jgi:hypothetical protein